MAEKWFKRNKRHSLSIASIHSVTTPATYDSAFSVPYPLSLFLSLAAKLAVFPILPCRRLLLRLIDRYIT
jgi:hypothetical protein